MVAIRAISTRSTAKARLLLVARMLVEPATNTTAVWISEYRAFIPSRQGVTMTLLMIDWNTRDAPPIAKAVISITTSLGARRSMA